MPTKRATVADDNLDCQKTRQSVVCVYREVKDIVDDLAEHYDSVQRFEVFIAVCRPDAVLDFEFLRLDTFTTMCIVYYIERYTMQQAAMLQIRVTPGGNRPIYRQVIDQVRQAVAAGELQVGDALPSVRQLAEQLVVNHNTVAKAYAELVRDGVLESRHGRGVFVGKRRCVFSAGERRRRLENALNIFLSEALTLDFNPQQIQEEVAKRLKQMTAKE